MQGNGNGQSSIPQTIGLVDGGVKIFIENTLSLSDNKMVYIGH